MRYLVKVAGVLAVAALAISTASAANKIDDAELAKLQKNMKDKKFVSLSFTQTRYKSLRKKKSTFTGKAKFKMPDHFYWAIDNSPQAWIYDGKHLMHYNKDMNKAVRYQKSTSKGKELTDIISMITRIDKLKDRYKITDAKKEKRSLLLEMIPRARTSDLESVFISFNLKQNYVEKLRLNFTGGNYSSFAFSGYSNADIPTSTFSLPRDVKVTTVGK